MFAIIYILCLVPVAKGVFQFFYLRRKSKSYIKTKGVVVGNHVDSMDSFHAGGYTYYYPIVEYQNAEGETIQITAGEYNPDRPMYQPGAKVDLLVNPQESNRFIFDEKIDRLVIPLVWVFIGVAAMLFVYFFVDIPA